MTGLEGADRRDRSDRIEMMRGRLDEFDLLTLLQTIGLGRQLVEIEVSDRNGHMVGRVVAKSGKVVAASAGRIRGLEAISQLTRSPMSHQFAVFRRSTGAGFLPELVSISELKLRFAQGTGELPRTVLLEGELTEFDLAALIQSVGTSRQFCAIEIEIDIDHQQSATGVVFIKAGNVVSASAGPMSGLAAMYFLLAAPQTGRFRVLQLPTTAPGMTSIGSVDDVLYSAQPPSQTHAAPHRPARGTETSRIESPRYVAAQGSYPPPLAAPPASTPHAVTPVASAPLAVTSELEVTNPRLATARPAAGEVVMEGQLADFDFRTLLHVLSATRQQVCLQIGESGQGELGEVTLKAGWILACQAGLLQDRNALALLLGAPKQLRFSVVIDDEQLPDEPLGRVDELIDSIRTGREPTASTPVVPAPAAPTTTRAPAWRTLRWAIPAALAAGAVAGVLHRLPDKPTPAESPAVAAAPPATETTATADTSATATTTAATPPLPTTKAATPPPPAIAAEAATATPPLPTTAAVASPLPTTTADTSAATTDNSAAAATPSTAEATPATADTTTAPPEAAQLPRGGRIKAAQAALAQLGYSPGPIDNVFGPQTRNAILAFQRAHHLTQTGRLDQDTWAAIVVGLSK